MLLDFFQKKSRLILSICLLVAQESWKQRIVCASIDSAFVWIKATRPAFDMLLAVQDWSSKAVLLTSSEKVSSLGLPLNTGNPKYFPRLSWCAMLKLVATTCLSWAVAFFENVMDDFWKLISFLEFQQNFTSKLLRRWHDSILERQKRRLSFTNKTQGILFALGEILNPIPHFFVFCAFS